MRTSALAAALTNYVIAPARGGGNVRIWEERQERKVPTKETGSSAAFQTVFPYHTSDRAGNDASMKRN